MSAQEALADGRLRPGGLVTEGTAGSTGISLALQANVSPQWQRTRNASESRRARRCCGRLKRRCIFAVPARHQAFGCRCHVAMPDDAAEEKSAAIRALGALQRATPPRKASDIRFVDANNRSLCFEIIGPVMNLIALISVRDGCLRGDCRARPASLDHAQVRPPPPAALRSTLEPQQIDPRSTLPLFLL